MEETTMKLSEGNEKVEVSLRDIEHMNDQMTAINDSVERIFDDIDRQSETTREFTDQVGNIADTYGMLTKECTDTGIHIFKIIPICFLYDPCMQTTDRLIIQYQIRFSPFFSDRVDWLF